MKKMLSLVLVMLLALSMMTFAIAEDEKVTVTVWCAYAGEDPYGHYVYDYAEAFMAANPDVNVEVTAVSSNDVYTKLVAMAATPDDIPTLFYTSADQAPSLVDIGLCADVSTLLSEETLNAFADGVVENCMMQGIMAFYPIDLQPQAILYRIDRFEEANLEIPTTWEEFLEASKLLTKDNDGDGENDEWGFSMVGSNNSSGQSRFMTYLWSKGLDIVWEEDGEWKTDMDSEEFLAAFSEWTDMNNVYGVVPTGITEITYPTAANYFAMGYTSMMMSGGNAMGVTYAAAPELKGKIGTFCVPGDFPGSMMNTEGYAVSSFATPEEQAAAVRFAEFYASNDPDLRFWQESGKLPATTEGQANEYLQGADYAGFLQTIANGCRPVSDFPGTGALKQILGDGYSAVFAGEMTNEEACESMYAEMQELLEDYN